MQVNHYVSLSSLPLVSIYTPAEKSALPVPLLLGVARFVSDGDWLKVSTLHFKFSSQFCNLQFVGAPRDFQAEGCGFKPQTGKQTKALTYFINGSDHAGCVVKIHLSSLDSDVEPLTCLIHLQINVVGNVIWTHTLFARSRERGWRYCGQS